MADRDEWRWARRVGRREFIRTGTAGLAALAGLGGLAAAASATACSDSAGGGGGLGSARLRARPHAPTQTPELGRQPIGLGSHGRDGLLYVPEGYSPDHPAPLIVLLHGAGRSSTESIQLFGAFADAEGLVLLAPDSRGATWDVTHGGYGPDIRFIDRALGRVFARCAIDPARVAVAGFSDGASYALSIGIVNGDLFRAVIGFSPGFLAVTEPHGTPRLFVSHGTQDPILPVQGTQQMVANLRSAGYAVEYREFDGTHGVPLEIDRAANDWLVAGWAGAPGRAAAPA